MKNRSDESLKIATKRAAGRVTDKSKAAGKDPRGEKNMKKGLTAEQYFAKYGYICGVSAKPGAGDRYTYGRIFYDLNEAEKWLHTEEYDFRERELLSKGDALKYYGIKFD